MASLTTERSIVVAMVWALFILVGTLFYNYYEGYGWAKGHFYAVNVGFNIGWNWDLEESEGSKIFSIFYLLLGYSLLAMYVVYIGDLVFSRHGRFSSEMDSETKRHTEVSRQGPLVLYIMIAWLLYVAVGVIWSCEVLGWSALDGFYFSLSSLSAGGMYSVPDDSADYVYAVAGIYTALGIPLMILAFGILASFLLFPPTRNFDERND